MTFQFVSEKSDCGVVILDEQTGEEIKRIPFPQKNKIGNVFFMEADKSLSKEFTYLFYEEDSLFPDERGCLFPGRKDYGKKSDIYSFAACSYESDYRWGKDSRPKLSLSDSLIYCLHVRGFTKDESSGVRGKGTFLGIEEKLPYLKGIGVTTIELQPAYEFPETQEEWLSKNNTYGAYAEIDSASKINYWGYKKGFYYAPKAAYSHDGDAIREFKNLVKALHKNNMELLMQFYFPNSVNRNDMFNILYYWAVEYHVDGFHLIGEGIPSEILASHPLLADRKLFVNQINFDSLRDIRRSDINNYIAEYDDSYYYTMRSFLKGDENLLQNALAQMRYLPKETGRIHYMSNYYGMTLADCVSYDHKHNEANGEESRDGTDYNCSWNCGEEGETRKRKVKQLRVRQIKNAMSFLLLTQSIPLIFMGDEFGNSQNGNNNPWCQDNQITWLNWKMSKTNKELLSFWKKLVALRKSENVLHTDKELKLMDTLPYGYPDLSYHSENAWRLAPEQYHRHAGILLCEAGNQEKEVCTDFLYVAINMHWERHELALPRLPKAYSWKKILSTDSICSDEPEDNCNEKDTKDKLIHVAPRSVTIYKGIKRLSSKGDRR